MKWSVLAIVFLDIFDRNGFAQLNVVGTAVPVPGITSNERLSYINPDATYMLVTVGTYPTSYTASRTWDTSAGTWGPPVQVLPGFSSAASLSPDGDTLYYGQPVGGPTLLFSSTWSGTAWVN